MKIIKDNKTGAIAAGVSILAINAFTAACPLCIIVISGSAGLSKYLGVDDTITGTWIGALLVVLSSQILKFLDKKNLNFSYKSIIIPVLLYTSTIIPLVVLKIIGIPENVLFPKFRYPIDKLMFGIVIGSIVFILGSNLHAYIKRKNHDKVLFPFQKVVIPVVMLLLTSLIFLFNIEIEPTIIFETNFLYFFYLFLTMILH